MKKRRSFVHCKSDSFLETATPFHLPVFEADEIQKGDRLGQGEFGVVHQISCIKLKRVSKEIEDSSGSDKQGDEKDVSNSSSCHNSEKLAGSGMNSSMKSFGSTDSLHSLPSVEKNLLLAADVTDMFLNHKIEEEYGDENYYCRRSVEFDEELVRKRMQQKYLRDGKARYAIKTLRKGTVMKYRREKKVLDALAVESQFLAVIEHPNIIKMRGVSNLDPLDTDYFIVIDRLYDTLDKKIKIDWKTRDDECKPSFLRKRDEMSKLQESCLLIERLVCAIDLSSALKFLHSISIVYRDLKPENIGFDIRGDVKLFDFGLAAELKEKDRTENGLYKFAGIVGSRRYMAPEMVLKKPSNEGLDTYAFGILLWEMCALEEPFEGYSIEKHQKIVAEKGQRPKLSGKVFKQSLKALIQKCWSTDIKARPDMDEVYNRLKNFVDELEGHKGGILDRSQHMMNISDKSDMLGH